MTLGEYYTRHIPEYYKTMYLDGYSSAEIYIALRKKICRELQERKEKEPTNFTIKSEVKVR